VTDYLEAQDVALAEPRAIADNDIEPVSAER